MVCQAARLIFQAQCAIRLNRFQKRRFFKDDLAGQCCKLCSIVTGHCIGHSRCFSHQDQLTARSCKGFQTFYCRTAQRFTAGNDNSIIGHCTDLQRVSCFRTQIGQKRFIQKVKVTAAKQQPAGHILEPFLHLLPDRSGLGLRSPVKPVAFDWMDDADTHSCLPTCHGCVYSCKMIFNCFIFLTPRRLIIDARRIITLCLPLHRNPGQMRHTQCNAQRRLPVSLQLMASEIKAPARYTIKLAHYAFTPKLMRCRLCLLCRRVFMAVTQHVDAGQFKASVRTHRLAQCCSLTAQCGLFHHMSGQRDIVLFAPCSHIVCKRAGKTLRHMIMIMIPDRGNASVCFFPNQLRELFQNILLIHFLIGLSKILCPGQDHIPFFLRKLQKCFMRELRLIRKDRRHRFSKLVPDLLCISLVGDFQETIHCRFVQRIYIGLMIVPGARQRAFQISIPAGSLWLHAFLQFFTGNQITLFIQNDIINLKQPAI